MNKTERSAIVKALAVSVRGYVTPLLAAIREEFAAKIREIPQGPEGKPGKDGVDGITGKDGESIIGPAGPQGEKGERGESVIGERGLQGIAGPKGDPGESITGPAGERGADGINGRDGKDGRDALQIDILPAVDESKRFPRGTFARYQNGLIRSFRDTDPLTGELEKSGWEVVVAGVAAVEVTQAADHRTVTVRSMLTGGTTADSEFFIPALIYREVFRDTEDYVPGDVVTYDGSAWHCQTRGTKAKPGTSPDWRLMVKRGQSGKDLRPPQEPINPGPVRL